MFGETFFASPKVCTPVHLCTHCSGNNPETVFFSL